MCALVLSNRRLRLRSKDSIDAELGKWEAGRDERLLNFRHRRSLVAEAEELLVIEAGLEHGVAGESQGLKVVAVTDSALELRRARASVQSFDSIFQRSRHYLRHAFRFLLVSVVGLADLPPLALFLLALRTHPLNGDTTVAASCCTTCVNSCASNSRPPRVPGS